MSQEKEGLIRILKAIFKSTSFEQLETAEVLYKDIIDKNGLDLHKLFPIEFISLFNSELDYIPTEINIRKSLRSDLIVNENHYTLYLPIDGYLGLNQGFLTFPTKENKRENARGDGLPHFSKLTLNDLYSKESSGYNVSILQEWIGSNDYLNHLRFILVVKKAQLNDERALNLLLKMYEEGIQNTARRFLVTLSNKTGLKFKEDGVLGFTNVVSLARLFVAQAIKGDDPRLLIQHLIRKKDDKAFESIFTKKLLKEFREIAIQHMGELHKTISEFIQLSKLDNRVKATYESDLESNNLIKHESLENYNRLMSRLLAIKKNEIDTLANPYTWIEPTWFNKQIFNPEINHSLTTYLFGSEKLSTEGKVWFMLKDWTKSIEISQIDPETKQRVIHSHHIELDTEIDEKYTKSLIEDYPSEDKIWKDYDEIDADIAEDKFRKDLSRKLKASVKIRKTIPVERIPLIVDMIVEFSNAPEETSYLPELAQKHNISYRQTRRYYNNLRSMLKNIL